MFIQTLPKYTQKNLALLGKAKVLKDFYLAGGSALTLYLGHRISKDLDFFTSKVFEPRNLEINLRELGRFRRDLVAEGTLHGEFNKSLVSFLYYKYPLLKPLKELREWGKIKIAQIEDIVSMKMDAISSRGRKRDFIDIYFVSKEVASLSKIINWYQRKYRESDYNLVHLIKSLTYFTDAEEMDEEIPWMIKPVKWQEVKKFFEHEVRKIKLR